MDYKISNFEVATEKICLEQTAELPLDADFTAADYLGEIKSILKCKITPYITGKQLSGNAVSIEGIARFFIIYMDTEDKLYTAEYEAPFKKLFESNEKLDNASFDITADATTHSCRAVTERRFSVKGSVKICVHAFVIEKKDIISDIDSNCFEQLKGTTNATTPLGIVEKPLIIDEELSIAQNMPSICRIIRSDACAIITDTKIINNKVIVKGNLKIDVSYCSEDNNLQKHTSDIPFNQVIDMIGISELCECEANVTVSGLNLSARTSQSGECRSFMAVCKLNITVSARCNSEIPVLFDVYSTKYKTTAKEDNVIFNRIIKQTNESFLCKKRLPIPDGCSNVVLDLWCSTNSISSRFDNDKMMLLGSISACALIENCTSGVEFFERIIDFEYPLNLEGKHFAPYCKPMVKILSCNHTVENNEIEFKIELMISATIYENTTISLISDLNVDEQDLITNDAALIAYYADVGENIWDISKQFLANRTELFELNRITDETVKIPRMLIIPRM